MYGFAAIMIAACGMAAVIVSAHAAPPTDSVRDRVIAQGFVRCGVDMTPGFSGIDINGRPQGFDVDFCRAVAAAVLGDADAIRTSRVSTRHKFDAVRNGELDVAFGMTTWTFSRDTELGVAFPAVTFYDGQGFMAWHDTDIKTPVDIRNTSICVQTSTTTAANLTDFLRGRGDVEIITTASSEDKFNAFAERRCLVVTGDRSELAVQRARRTASPEAWTLLRETISREPLGPIVAANDTQWFAIVRWAVLVPAIAEARGLTRHSVGTGSGTDDEMRRLMGLEAGFGAALGLNDQWAKRIVGSVGSYGEIFNRNLKPLGLERGDNTLWRDGGLIYAPPLR